MMSVAYDTGFEAGENKGYSAGLKTGLRLGGEISVAVLRDLDEALTKVLGEVRKMRRTAMVELENTS